MFLVKIYHVYCSRHTKIRMGSQAIDKERKEERIRPKKRELHGLLYTKIVKSGTIRLASGYRTKIETYCKGNKCLRTW